MALNHHSTGFQPVKSARCALSDLSGFLTNLRQPNHGPKNMRPGESFTPAASVQDDGIFESKCINSRHRLPACAGVCGAEESRERWADEPCGVCEQPHGGSMRLTGGRGVVTSLPTGDAGAPAAQGSSQTFLKLPTHLMQASISRDSSAPQTPLGMTDLTLLQHREQPVLLSAALLSFCHPERLTRRLRARRAGRRSSTASFRAPRECCVWSAP